LEKALSLNIPVLSFPEYIYRQSQDKQRVVVAGSHGKSTTTGMIVHVLNYLGRSFDYVMGARVEGIEGTVRLSEEAPVIIIEGDEYPASALDSTPKFLRYQHHIGLITGIAWDHANVFPDENEYVHQFDLFADSTPKGGILIYCESDPLASVIGAKERTDVQSVPYRVHPHVTERGRTVLTSGKEKFPVQIFGAHNFLNVSGAKEVLKKVGVTPEEFNEAITHFKGIAGRLEKFAESKTAVFYKDFAHAPSKVKASIRAIKEQYPSHELIAVLELHTYSSLSKQYLPEYKHAFKGCQTPVVYFNPEAVSAKHLPPLTPDEVKGAFGTPAPRVFNDAGALQDFLNRQNWKNKTLLMMSSGNFGGMDLKAITKLFV
jgi:UDP-N-acetylmuramate: L-alanyl-gamma-D-glutamyl-meso-diaminopimelate ligase